MQPDDGAPETVAPADDYYYYTEDGYYYELARRPGVGSEGPRQEALPLSIRAVACFSLLKAPCLIMSVLRC